MKNDLAIDSDIKTVKTFLLLMMLRKKIVDNLEEVPFPKNFFFCDK